MPVEASLESSYSYQMYPRPDELSPHAKSAIERLMVALEFHESARSVTGQGPRIQMYRNSVQSYTLAAESLESLALRTRTDSTRRRLRAWMDFSLAMRFANVADIENLLPGESRGAVYEATDRAVQHLNTAYDLMAALEPPGSDRLLRWRILRSSIQGLGHRARGEDADNHAQYRQASSDFRMSALSHEESASLARQMDDEVAVLRIMGRSWWGKSDEFRTAAQVANGKARLVLLERSAEAARIAATFRPGWVPFEQVLARAILLKDAAERSYNRRTTWIQVVIGFVLGFIANVFVTWSFNRLGK